MKNLAHADRIKSALTLSRNVLSGVNSEAAAVAISRTDDALCELESLQAATVEPGRSWFVWSKRGWPPRFAHGSLESAEREAQRLANKYPGQKFHVLRAEAKFSVEAPDTPVACFILSPTGGGDGR